MKMKLMNKKIFAAKFFKKGIWQFVAKTTVDFYVEGQQELSPFYMWIPHGNAFCADSCAAGPKLIFKFFSLLQN